MTHSGIHESAQKGVLPTGTQYTIAAGGYQAVLTEVGAGIRSLTFGDRPLLMEYPPETGPVGGAGQVLIPWPNRVKDGRYTFDGNDRQLAITEPATGNAIHGFVRRLPWTVLSEGPSSIMFGLRLFPQLGYPHVLDLTVSYSLGPSGLESEVTAANVGATDAPYGLGLHPYLTLGPGTLDDAVLEVPADQWIEVDERGLPIGRRDAKGTEYDFREARPIGDLKLDTPYTGLTRGADDLVRVRLRAADGSRGVELWGGEGVEWLQLFTGDTLPEPYRRGGIAVEPMTCPPNAFATGEDLIRLAPGHRVTHRWGVTALASS
jgi:aldose 1-epimerase